ncbi:MAG: hypothetical protein AAF654_03520 [Myxococcota bacterium]
MTIVSLVKVTVVGDSDRMEETLTRLQTLGCLHLIPLASDGTTAVDSGSTRESNQALQFLASASRKRHQESDRSRFDAIAVERQALDLEKRLFQLRNERDQIESRIEALAPWGEFEFPDRADIDNRRMWFYAVPHHLMGKVQTIALPWELIRRDHRYCYLVVLSESEPEVDALPVLRTHVGSRSSHQLIERREQISTELDDIEAERFELTRWCTLLADALDGLDDRALRSRAALQALVSKPVFALQAWAPQTQLDALTSTAEELGLALEIQSPRSDEEPPALLDNPAPLRGGEDLVTFYMTPSYWLWDPSSVVFFSFAVFFAMILADVGYALVLGVLCFGYWQRLGESATGRRWRLLLATLCASTTTYGVLVGSYFGLSPAPGSLLDHLRVLDLNDFDTMMTLSVAVGVVHIAYANLRNAGRHPNWSARLAPTGWAAVVVGGFVCWLGMQHASDGALFAGAGVAGAGMLCIIGFTGLGERPMMRAFHGVSALTGLSSAFGDVLSYLRLFALGLASASLAQAFNGMAGDVRDAVPGLGIFLGLLVLVVGHTLNFVLSLASGVIHGLRLNVIEFFNWGVKDEGRPFRRFEKKESRSWTISS